MKKLIDRLKNDRIAVAESLGNEAAEALETLTAERDALKVSDKRNFEKLVTACLEKDALKAEIVRLAGEATVLRELLAESLSVIKTIDGADECECDLLESLCAKIKTAIVPQPSREQQAANEKQLSIDVDLMARGKKLYFVYPPESEKTGDLL